MRTCSKFFLLFFLFSPSLFAFDIEGKVELKPPWPEPRSLPVAEKHVADCGQSKVSPKLQISSQGGVANAIVKLEGPFDSTEMPREGNFVLDQKNCEFTPHVLLIPQGTSLSIANSDGFLHNVRAFNETTEMLFNDAMPKKGQVLKKTFDWPGRYIVRCGLHAWMHALLVVQEHPFYALTNEEGRFKISGIPEGTYQLSVWHESLGALEAQVKSEAPFVTLTYPAAD